MPPGPDAFATLSRLEGVQSAAAAARDGIDARLRDRGLRRTGPELTTRSLELGARASAELERRTEDPGYDDGGALRLSAQLLGLLPTWRRAPLQALARMHLLAAAGTVGDELIGRPVRQAERLAELARGLTRPTAAPALVVAAVVHAEIATARPFSSANGVVARAAERLVLVERGVDPVSATVPEAGHLALLPAYRAALDGYADATTDGVRGWVLHCTRAYARGAELSPLPRAG